MYFFCKSSTIPKIGKIDLPMISRDNDAVTRELMDLAKSHQIVLNSLDYCYVYKTEYYSVMKKEMHR